MKQSDLIRATLAGEATERLPYAFWTHFPGIDLDPPALVRETIAFARTTGSDFIKSMPNGLYCVEDWGVEADYSEIAKGGVARVVSTPVHAPEDWKKVKRLDVTAGALGRELDHLARLVAEMGDVPVLATVFSPMTIAKKLAEAAFREHLQTHPELIEAALAEIAVTTAEVAKRAIEIGCAGVFFASQEATHATGAEAYARFGVPYDEQVLEGAKKGWFNAVHMHGEDILFEQLSNLSVHALNWHIGETSPSIAEYRASGGRKPILGGLRRMAITRGETEKTAEDIAAAKSVDGGRGIILAPGCVIRYPVDLDALAKIGARIRGEI